MSLSQLFADSVFARLLRGEHRHGALITSMVGLKLGDRLLVVGLDDARMLATLAAKVGITGRACGVDVDESAAARAERAAERAGVLVEVVRAPDLSALPWEANSFDVVVVRSVGRDPDTHRMSAAIESARRVLRDGGRCVVVGDSANRGEGSPAGEPLVGALKAAGYRAARILADRDGLVFAEAVIRHQPATAGREP